MGVNGKGVELRDKSIRIGFSLNGKWTRETLLIAPTLAGERYALQMLARVKRAIADGTFDYAVFFPDSKNAPRSSNNQVFGDLCDEWLKTKGRLADKTLKQYGNAIDVWKRLFGAQTLLADLTHSKVAGMVSSQPWASPKLLNNYLICLRGVFKLASRELKIDNAMTGVENSKHQAKGPDPLTLDEMRAILKWMYSNVPEPYYVYYRFAFSTGMRPEEIIALRWSDVDGKSIRVSHAKTSGKLKPLKTYEARDVDLVETAAQAIEDMRWRQDEDEFIFHNPYTGQPLYDERSQRDNAWTPALKALGIKPRRAYCTRHTYATIALMSGANPAYIARQMGHKNPQMLFRVYSKWIDGADKGRERDKVDKAFVY